MLEDHGLARLRQELIGDLTSPRAVFERFARPSPLLNRRHVLPSLVIAGTETTMQWVENSKLCGARSIQDVQHVGNTIIRFRNRLQVRPEFAALGNKIVVRIDDEKSRDLFVKFKFWHLASVKAATRPSQDSYSSRQVRPCLLRRHVFGIPIGPILVAMTKTLLVRAVGSFGAPHRARQGACGTERSYARIDASGQSRCDLLQQPTVAIGIAKQCARTVGATFGIQTSDWAIGGQVEDLADIDARGYQCVPGGLNVGHD